MSSNTKKFTAEVGKVLQLMIHSLYTNKDIFIRELVSNASDACDKLKYLSYTDASLLSDGSDFEIVIAINKDTRELIIEDNGIGMSLEDMAENLGTIAKSGTQEFLKHITGDAKKDSNLIGQFGVGFYSSFMVADSVKVISKKAGTTEVGEWFSCGDGEYTISSINDETMHRGTRIIAKIKEGLDEYLDHFRVKHIVKTYSDHIDAAVYFIEENGHKHRVNSSIALWTKNKADITEEQYQEFYKSVAYAVDKPWVIMHNKNEGLVEYTNLLFIPTNKTFDLFHPDRRKRVKLYIKKVFITDENVDLVPAYMRFLRGVVDSQDLPLNISRESLQHNATIDKIRNSITKKVLAELLKQKESDRDSYEIFWKNFGAALKEGLCEVNPDQEKILDCALFYSATKSKYISLDEYISSLPEGLETKTIYYLSGEHPEKLKNSPQIEGYLARNIDVLIFNDPVDDFWVNVANQYKDFEIKSVTRSSSLDQDKNLRDAGAREEETKEDLDAKVKILTFCKNTLQEAVREVVSSSKLTSSPAVLSVGLGDMDIRMERFLLEQKQLQQATSKILEVNLKHPILQKIACLQDQNESQARDLVWLLFDEACIIEGEPVKDAAGFSRRLNILLEKAA
ncbi:MAG: molecular chaperone HtpG [Rickettsiaceae bacterium]|nr:molecular chaperone HtpG [Rickettsiaceae bacterium]